ncbi:MAG: ATP-binding cassette domain-containing protein, partial [Spirochaetaceae bacterium]
MEEEEILVLVGPSGCGKTTLLRVMAGIIPPTTGRAYDAGVEITAPSRRRGIVFQNPHLYPWLTVSGNVEFGLRMRKVKKSS